MSFIDAILSDLKTKEDLVSYLKDLDEDIADKGGPTSDALITIRKAVNCKIRGLERATQPVKAPKRKVRRPRRQIL